MGLEEKLKTYRLSTGEYKMICDQLGREPQGVEWALYSALWSEHCSYKSSKVHLKNPEPEPINAEFWRIL